MMPDDTVHAGPGVPLAGVISEAVRSRSRSHSHALRDCARSPSPGAVRRLRTSTRRLAAILDLAARLLPGGTLGRCRKRLRSLLRDLSALRDIDVVLSFVGSHAPPNLSLALYGPELAAARRRMAPGLRESLVSKRDPACAATAAYAANHIAGQDGAALAAALAGHLGSTLGRVSKARRHAAAGSPRRIHRLRIAFRRLRYAAEALGPALDGFTTDDLGEMNRLHSLLGRIQDLRVVGRGVERFGRSRNQVVRDELAPVIESVRLERADLIRAMGPAADSALSYWTGRPIIDHNEGPT
jgi:CHAD domain-containing protein